MGDSVNSQLQVYKQLLNETTKYHNSDGTQHRRELKEEDKKFIENALKESMKDSDPARKMAEILDNISKTEDTETKLLYIDDLIDIVCQVDFATIYALNYKGLEEIKNNINSKNDEKLTCAYISLLTTITHNNLEVQDLINKYSKEFNFLEYLLEEFIKKSNVPSMLKKRSLGAVAAIVNNHRLNFSMFLSLKGVESLKNIVNNEDNEEILDRTKFTLNLLKSSLPDVDKDDTRKYISDILYLKKFVYNNY
uniref:Fes1 domain-containing protein n=1 Tax=Parastrongyloides trichosuri TaxID=131310 RepID=A0A0N4ZRD8_PARTI